jgi:putative ABC transport system permease protein
MVRESVASIAARPARSLLTMTGTVLGCAAFIAIIGLTATASGQITGKFNELEATTLTVRDARAEQDPAAPMSLPARIGPVLRGLNGVVDAGLYFKVPLAADADADAGAGGGAATIAVRPQADGIDPASGAALSVYGAEPGTLAAARVTLASGRGLDEFHLESGQPVAVLGFAAAGNLGIATIATRPTVFIGDDPYQLIGILAEGGALPELGSAVIVPATVAIDRYGEPAAGEPARALVRTELGAAALIAIQAPLALRPDHPDRLAVAAPPDWSMVTDDVNTSMNSLLLVLAGIALIIGTVAIANTTLVAVMERTGEIGLRQALGAKPVHVLAQFLIESSVLGAIGGLIGSAVGVGAVVAGALIRHWTPVLDPLLPLTAPLIGIAVGALAGLYPSHRASRIPPAAALQRV